MGRPRRLLRPSLARSFLRLSTNKAKRTGYAKGGARPLAFVCDT